MYDGCMMDTHCLATVKATDSCLCVLQDSLHPEYTRKLQLEVKKLCVLRTTDELHEAVTICRHTILR